ncbi:ABC transporter ATP-binding protein [Staphylothermus hellenicus]|uniref:ABC transporter related protein n=1 Tax=Staphylothermus hellenicus (strain DSM 12710 / JCM 10830 / BK20S6-10-b1 / P8) TaxID=591019 RepID=D7D8S1_STAHD|nr:ABC transporter ATP-binding protein [Staphylothermus hellenicus]ADI32167.1 ABC transporter related protein [Staphylothermus hellenicus DSM 12710]
MSDYRLQVIDLHKIYNNKTYAVRGISFNIKPGEIFGLIGPNGAGKTTTLRIIAGLLKPTRGKVLFEGANLVENIGIAKKNIGYLPEEAGVYSRLTGYEHLKLYAMLYEVGDVEKMIKYGAELSGLGDKLRKRAETYSKGMKRRLLLALVLMRKPALAILDEPTSGLDVYASVRVRHMIKKYVKETNSSVLLSSHNMLEVEYLCDRVAFIHQGKIFVEGTPEEIKDLYGADNLEEAFVKAVEETRG